MSSGVVRELVTLWGFDIDQKPLRELDAGINTIKGTLKTLAVSITATVGTIGLLLNEAGKQEQVTVAFETMVGGIEEADELLRGLYEFAKTTPFTIPGIEKSAKLLLGMGIETEKMLPTLKALGDVAAGLSVPLDRIALNFGQIKTQGKLTGRELRDFAVAGVPLLDELAKQYGKTKEEVTNMVSAGKVGFPDVEKAFISMSSEGGKFANLMDKQSKTLFGLISNLQDFGTIFARELGKEVLPVAKEIVSATIQWVQANRKMIQSKLREWLKSLTEFLGDMVDFIMTFKKAADGVAGSIGGWNNVLKVTFGILSSIMSLGMVAGIGLVTKAVFGLAMAWKAMGTAALWAQVKMALIPLTIGAIVIAIALIAEDILAFSQGRDSVFGRMINGLDEIFAAIKEKFGIFGEIGQFIITALLTPIRSVINMFKSLIDIFDVLRGKISIMQGLKNIGGNLANSFGFNGATDSFSGALGVGDAVNAANARANSDPGAIPGLGGMPFSAKGSAETAASGKVEQTLNLNVTGMDPETAKDLVTGTIKEEMGGMFRSAVRDGESQVER